MERVQSHIRLNILTFPQSSYISYHSHLHFLLYEENFAFFYISAPIPQRKAFSANANIHLQTGSENCVFLSLCRPHVLLQGALIID
jgi:hypothetical protein